MIWNRTSLRDRYGSPMRRANLVLTEGIVYDLQRMAADDGVSASELVRDLIADECARRAALRHRVEYEVGGDHWDEPPLRAVATGG